MSDWARATGLAIIRAGGKRPPLIWGLLLATGLFALTGGAGEGVNGLMRQGIAPASDAIFQAAADLPESEHAWLALSSKLYALQAGSFRLHQIDACSAESAWQHALTNYDQAMLSLRAAISSRDGEALAQAGDILYASCADCHQTRSAACASRS